MRDEIRPVSPLFPLPSSLFPRNGRRAAERAMASWKERTHKGSFLGPLLVGQYEPRHGWPVRHPTLMPSFAIDKGKPGESQRRKATGLSEGTRNKERGTRADNSHPSSLIPLPS